MAFSQLVDSVKQTSSNLLPSTPEGPLATTHNDIVCRLFSFLTEHYAAAFGRTCRRFNALYLVSSPLALGFSQLYTNLQQPAIELASSTPSNADEKLQQFLDNFQKSLSVLKPDFLHEKIEIFSDYAQHLLRSTFREIEGGITNLALLLRAFNTSLFKQMVENYAKLPLEEITFDSFQTQVAFIRKVFYMRNNYDIEAELRKAILVKHNASEFDAMIKKLTDLDSPQIAPAKAVLETKLLVEKYELQKELSGLPPKVSEKVKEQAREEKTEVLIQRNKALFELCSAFKESANLPVFTGKVVAQIDAFLEAPPENTPPDTIARLQRLLADFQEKDKTLAEKRKVYDQYTRSDEIAQYLPGSTTLCGGRLFELDKQLKPEALDGAVRNEMEKLHSFYEEIRTPVDKSEEFARYQTLHFIMGVGAEA